MAGRPYAKKTYRIGLVRVMTFADQERIDQQGRLLEKRLPIIKVTSQCIPDQPRGIPNAEAGKIAAPKILQVAKGLQREGAEVVIISCAEDPALETARSELTVPVIGAGSATAAVARSLGRDIGVIGITDRIPAAMAEVLGNCLVGYEKIEGVQDAMDLHQKDPRTRIYQAAVNLAKGRHIDVIAFACAGIATLGIDDAIEKELGVYAVNPVLASGIQALFALLRKDGGAN